MLVQLVADRVDRLRVLRVRTGEEVNQQVYLVARATDLGMDVRHAGDGRIPRAQGELARLRRLGI